MRFSCFIIASGLLITLGSCGSGKPNVPATPESLTIAIEGGDERTVKALLDAMPSLANAKNAIGDTPLHTATRAGRSSIVQVLLKCKADRNITNQRKLLPMHLAAKADNRQIFDLLSEPLPELEKDRVSNMEIAKARATLIENEDELQKALNEAKVRGDRARGQ